MEHIIESTKTTEFFFRGKNGTLEITSRREHHFNHAAKRYHLYDLFVSFLKACDELPRELFTTKSGELNAALFDSVLTVVASESFKSKTLITPTLKVASSNLVWRSPPAWGTSGYDLLYRFTFLDRADCFWCH